MSYVYFQIKAHRPNIKCSICYVNAIKEIKLKPIV